MTKDTDTDKEKESKTMAKAKKMTLKEFKEVFERAGYSFDVWGYEGILTLIEGYEWSQYNNFKDDPKKQVLARATKKRIDSVHDDLEKIGYYKNLG